MLARFLINGEYAKLWLAELVSLLGDAIFDTTLLLWVGTRVAHGYSWAPLAASGVLIAVALPGMVFGPVAGVFVDRWNLQRTMLVADALRALLVALLFGMALLPAGTLGAPAQLVAIYLVVALASVCSQFFNPARFAFIGDLVTADERPRASSIGQATSSAAAVIGPPLAAPLLITVGVQWALLFNALSFVASFAAVRAIRAPAIERAPAAAGPGFWPQFLDGVRFYVTHRVLMAVLATAGLVTVGAAVLNALDVFFITDNLHTSATWLGTLSTALGLGSIAGALLAGWVTGRLGLARTYSVGLFLAGVAMVAYSRSTSIGVALAFVFLAGLPIAAVNSVVGPILLKVTPREYLGRVFSVVNPALQVAAMASIAVSGWLASTLLRGFDARVLGLHLGTYDTLYGVGGVLVAAGGLWALAILPAALRAESVDAPSTAPTPAAESALG